jgi:hypothetical protein
VVKPGLASSIAEVEVQNVEEELMVIGVVASALTVVLLVVVHPL